MYGVHVLPTRMTLCILKSCKHGCTVSKIIWHSDIFLYTDATGKHERGKIANSLPIDKKCIEHNLNRLDTINMILYYILEKGRKCDFNNIVMASRGCAH